MASPDYLKGTLATLLLKLLADNGRMYGYQICKEVALLTTDEVKITEAALYPALHKLEAEGLLEVELEKVGNRVRKYYRLTEGGKAVSVQRVNDLHRFMEAMNILLNPKTGLG